MHWFGSLVAGSKAVLLRGVKPEWILKKPYLQEQITIVWLLVPWARIRWMLSKADGEVQIIIFPSGD